MAAVNEMLGTRQGLLLRRLGGASEAGLAMGLLATARRVDDAYNSLLASNDLSGGRFAALLAVDEEPRITPARLAERLEVRRATVTGLIDGLVRRGLVVRGSDESDRRVQNLTATESGHARIAEVLPLVSEWMNGLIDGLDRDTTWSVINLVHDNLRRGHES